MMPLRRRQSALKMCKIVACLSALALPVMVSGPALADDDSDGEGMHTPAQMRKLADKPPLPRAQRDFAKYRFRPKGDKVMEQPENNRLLFWTQDGRPDGYAQRRGNSVIYYNAQGQATQIQRLTPAEMAD
ncbi:MAG: hypothetical protein ABF990_06190 [Acetobacter sp.]|uniref:hypothetical protein n=1 Tax=Acetobacter sp. TaxID=440 RepID=UPI0039EB12C6